MPCDALTYHFIAAELDEMLRDGKIEKINMPEHDEVFLTIRANRQRHTLVLSAGNNPRVYVTMAQKENPLAPPAFCMNLRKNIGGGIIKSITTLPFERVIYIDILHKNELGIRQDKRLICEIMGKYSNLIVCDENQKILESLKHIPFDVSRKRQILPGLMYQVPTQDKLTPMDSQKIAEIKFTEDLYQDIIQNVMGLSPKSIAEAIYNAKVFDIDQDAIIRIAKELKNLFTLPLNPCIISEKNSDFFIRPYNSIKGEYKYFDNLCQAMDAYYLQRDFKQRLAVKSRTLSSSVNNALKRAKKRLSDFYHRLRESDNYENDRILGEIITTNIYKISSGMTSLKAENFYDGGSIEITLDPLLSPAKNAQQYFKRYSKKKRTLDATNELIEKTKKDIDTYEQIIFSLENITDLNELNDIAKELSQLKLIKQSKNNKREKPSSPLETLVDGFNIYVGKNNVQNERLYKNAAKNDIWLHTRLTHGSHVIIETNGREVPKSVILAAAQHAAHYSRARDAEKVEVDYTLVRHVKKPSGAGFGKVVYANQKTLFVAPKPIEKSE